MAESLSFWQYVRERWPFVLFWIPIWNSLCWFVLPHLPFWVSIVVYGTALGYLSHQWGLLTERKRHLRELLAVQDAHRADIDRFLEFLAAARGDVDAIRTLVERRQATEKERELN